MSQLIDEVYPRTGDLETVCLRETISKPSVEVGEYTTHNDFVNDPVEFEKSNVLYQCPISRDRLAIGKFCLIAYGAKFILNSTNHTPSSLPTYPFSLFFEEWGLEKEDTVRAWDSKGDIVVGNDVWTGYEAVIMAGATIGDGAVVGARAIMMKDVPPHTVIGEVPTKEIRKRSPEETVATLLEIRWWDWPKERTAERIGATRAGNSEQLR